MKQRKRPAQIYYGVRFPKPLSDKIKRQAAALGVSKTEVVRRAVVAAMGGHYVAT